MRTGHLVFLVLMSVSFSSCDFGCSDDDPVTPDLDISFASLIYPPNNHDEVGRCPVFIWDGRLEDDYDGSYTFKLELSKMDSEDKWMISTGRDTVLWYPDTLEAEADFAWRIWTYGSGDRIISTGFDYFSTTTGFNNPPGRAVPVYPAHGEHGIPMEITALWTCFDPDGDEIEYDIWYRRGEEIDSTYVSGLSAPEYHLLLDADEYYNWKIFSRDTHGLMTSTREFAFRTVTTVPPHDPFPVDGASDVPSDLTLRWSCSDPDGDLLMYDVEMGQAGSGMSLIASSIAQDELPVTGLSEGVTYEWKVTAEDDDGHRTEGPVWTFTTIGGSEVIFADLTLNRRMTRSGIETVVIDNIWARFDESYAPQYALRPLRPDTVICGEYGLEWQAPRFRFYYENAHTLTFLVPGESYEFTVAEGGGVPAFTGSVTFPMCAPTITSPESFQSVSTGGFEVTWSGYAAFPSCDSPVTLEIHELGGIPTGVSITTDNDGSYTFTAGDLSALDPMVIDAEIVLIFENRVNISRPGYDPRSWVRARNVSAVTVYFE